MTPLVTIHGSSAPFCAANAIEGSVSEVVSSASCTEKSGYRRRVCCVSMRTLLMRALADEECVQEDYVFPTPMKIGRAHV